MDQTKIGKFIARKRKEHGLTQMQLAEKLSITDRAVSKWETGESYPDITFLPALANMFETSVDLLIGMDTIRAEETRYRIHQTANQLQRLGDYQAAEKVYRDALLIYPNKPGMMLGLVGVLSLLGKYEEAIDWVERGLPLSSNEKQKATMRAVLCFLYLKSGLEKKADMLASKLPHKRECREAIQPLISQRIQGEAIDKEIRRILLGLDDTDTPEYSEEKHL